jgi:hypothetical protein
LTWATEFCWSPTSDLCLDPGCAGVTAASSPAVRSPDNQQSDSTMAPSRSFHPSIYARIRTHAANSAAPVPGPLTARSLSELDDPLTVIQLRAPVLLNDAGTFTVSEPGAGLELGGSAVTRLCDRLVREPHRPTGRDAHPRPHASHPNLDEDWPSG